MRLDGQMKAVVDGLAAAGFPPYDTLGAEKARSLSATLSRASRPGPALWQVDDIPVAAQDRVIPCRLYRPAPAVAAVVIFMHGGGWVLGDLDSHDALCRTLAARTGMAFLAIGYRLAPEFPAPAAIADVSAVAEWAEEHFARLAGPDTPLALCGDSAGGNLALVTAMLASDKGRSTFFHQLLFYPIADCDFTTASYLECADAPILGRSLMQWFWDQYCPIHNEREDWRFSPLRRPDMRGLPSTTIVTAEYDPLRDEGEALGQALRAAEIPVVLRREAGLTHGFAGMFSTVAAADRALDFGADQLKQALLAWMTNRSAPARGSAPRQLTAACAKKFLPAEALKMRALTPATRRAKRAPLPPGDQPSSS